MIEISARLVKGPAYLAGDVIECIITFSNPEDLSLKKSHSYSDVVENLAWASAQIHCQCTTSNKVVGFKTSKDASPQDILTANPDNLEDPSDDTISESVAKDTSFAPCKGDTGHVVFSSKPKILFCDLRLAMGEVKTYVYREVLASEVPPSYRGQAVKYSYKITIGTQRVNSPTKLLRVPFRVLVLSGVADTSPCGDSEDLTPSNPFLEAQRRETPLDIALQMLQNVTARRSPNFYNITNGRGKVVRFCLFKQAYKLGEDIVGTFDFSDSTVTCVQYSVTLQSEETVADEHKASPKQSPTIVSYNKHHETCINWNQSQLVLPIPLHVTPAFASELVNLKWRLHFEFVTTVTGVTAPAMLMAGRDDKTWQGPAALDIETMVWNLPLKILPTNAQHVSHGVNTPTKHSLTI